jgi:transposase
MASAAALLPALGTVYHYFRLWLRTGTRGRLHRAIYAQARLAAGRSPCPSLVIMDGQSVKTTGRGGVRGFDGHKLVKGRKRHILVDTLGLILTSGVEPASIPDQHAGRRLLGGLRPFFPAIRTVMADTGHQSCKLGPCTQAARGLAAGHHQARPARVQDQGPDLDRGAQLRLARPQQAV